MNAIDAVVVALLTTLGSIGCREEVGPQYTRSLTHVQLNFSDEGGVAEAAMQLRRQWKVRKKRGTAVLDSLSASVRRYLDDLNITDSEISPLTTVLCALQSFPRVRSLSEICVNDGTGAVNCTQYKKAMMLLKRATSLSSLNTLTHLTSTIRRRILREIKNKINETIDCREMGNCSGSILDVTGFLTVKLNLSRSECNEFLKRMNDQGKNSINMSPKELEKATFCVRLVRLPTAAVPSVETTATTESSSGRQLLVSVTVLGVATARFFL